MQFTETEENSFLDSTILRVDDEICALVSKKAILRRRVNALRERTRLLPPETLTTIFEYAIHENNHPIAGVATVCYRWRQVVWTSPTLWTSIPVTSSKSGAWNLLNLYRQNAKDASLSIHILTHHGFKAPLRTLLELLRVALTDCTSKSQSLDFGPLDKTVWEFIAPYAIYADFPRLYSLKLDFKHSFHADFEGVPFARSPRLRRIELKEPLPGIELQLPFYQITTLVLTKPHPAHAFHILSCCPNIVEFRSEGCSPPSFEELDFNLVVPVTLHNLEIMYWSSGQFLSNAIFISDLQLPNLRELSWLSPLNPIASHVWEPLFATMTSINTLDCTYSLGLLELLNSLPSLGRVHIKFQSFFDNLYEITDFLSHLIWRGRNRTLPRLVELSITLEDQNKVVSKERLPFHDVMVQGLESRRVLHDPMSCLPLRKFALRLSVMGVWGSWQRCLVNELRRLNELGLDITVVQ